MIFPIKAPIYNMVMCEAVLLSALSKLSHAIVLPKPESLGNT